MSFQPNETVIIKRGKLAGKRGTVSDVSAEDVAIKLEDGTGLSIQKLTNLKAPEQATISEGDLAAVFQTELGVTDDREVFASLVHAIDAKLPGFAQRITL